MTSTTPNQDGVFGRQKFASGNNEFNSLSFMMQQMMNSVNIATLVKVVAVHAGTIPSITGTVDVTPLVEQLDGAGQAMEHATIFGLPYFRMQGGVNAVILDPKKDDVGFCVFADRDISNAMDAGQAGPAASERRFNFADGMYIGGWSPVVVPTRFLSISDDGIKIMTVDKPLSITASGITETTTGTVTRTAASVTETYGAVTVTVPEFNIIGNLHVTGLVHCTWQGELIAVKYGGSGADLSATGGPGMVVKQDTLGGAFTVGMVESAEVMTKIQLGDVFAVNDPFTIVAGKAQHLTAIDGALPQVDGIVLGAGVADDFVVTAMNANQYYTSTGVPGTDGADLFLSKTGTLTDAVPSAGTGFVWSVPLARRVSSTSFVLNPEPAIMLA